MLRLLYKTLLISVMSGSLCTLNITAYAQETETNTETTTTTTSTPAPQMSKAKNTGVVRDANGVYKKTETKKFEGTEGKEDNALHVITMFAVAFIGVKLLTYKKWTLDMTIVAAGAAAYIAAEIVNIMNLRKQIKDMDVQLTKSSDGKIDQAQIETLEKLKESYEKVKAAIETRKKLQMAAAAVFAGATAVAAYQRWSEDGKFASCEAGIASGQTALLEAIAAAEATTPVGTALIVDFKLCQTQLTLLAKEIGTYKTKCEAAKGSSLTSFMATNPDWTLSTGTNTSPCPGTSAAIQSTFVTPACSTYLGEAAYNKAYGITAPAPAYDNGFEKFFFKNKPTTKITKDDSIAPPQGLKKYLESSMNLLFPKAEAGTLAMLGFGAGAAAAFAVTYFKMSQTIDTWMYTPGARIIAWGILAAAAMMGAKASQDEIDNVQKHIDDIDKILTEMHALKAGIKANNVNEQQIKLAGFNPNVSTDLQLNPNANVKTDCLSNGSNGACASLENQIKEMPGFANLPDSFKSISTQSARLGDGLSGSNSISGSTLTTAGNLANNANAISKLAAGMKSKLNDSLAKNGKAKIDFDKEEGKLLSQLKSDASKALGSKGMSASGLLSSIGVGSFDASKKANIASISTPDLKKKSQAGAIGGGAAAAPAKDKAFELDFKEAGAGDAGMAGAATAGKDAQYDIGQNDINTNSGESIFQMISNRYFKSGYPKLLEEEAPVKK